MTRESEKAKTSTPIGSEGALRKDQNELIGKEGFSFSGYERDAVGPQLFTGLTSSPTFKLGTFQLDPYFCECGEGPTAQALGDATLAGDFRRVVMGIAVMAFFVVVVNRLFWQPLYWLAERKYRLT